MATPEMMRSVFDEFDKDRSGTIDVAELSVIVSHMNGGFPVSPTELDAMMKAVDKDKSGEIDFEEFCTLMKSNPDPTAEMKAAFKEFDTDSSGSISTAEVRSFQPDAARQLALGDIRTPDAHPAARLAHFAARRSNSF